MPKSLYQRLVEAGVEVANHHSDLYFPANPVTTKIIVEARADGVYASKPSRFKSQTNGEVWFDAAFQYDPYWKARSKR